MAKYAEPAKVTDKKILFLDGYQEALKDVGYLERQIQEKKAAYMRIAGIDYRTAGIPKGKGGTRDMSGFFAKVDEYEKGMLQTRRRAERTRARILQAIQSLKRKNQRDVLAMRYLSGMSWHAIADEMQLTEQRAQDLHDLAVKNLEIPDDPKPGKRTRTA